MAISWQAKIQGVDTYATMLPAELEAYHALCRRGPHLPMLEVGAYKGISTIVGLCAAAAEGLPGTFVVDPFNHDGLNQLDVYFEAEFRANIAKAGFEDEVTAIAGRLQDIQLPAQEFRLILIDGDHGRPEEDYAIVRPHLAPGGTLVLHDWNWGHAQIDELAQRLRKSAHMVGFTEHLWWARFN